MAITNCVESWGGKGTSTLAVEETCTSSSVPILLSAASGNRIHPGRGVAASSGLRKPPLSQRRRSLNKTGRQGRR